MAKVMNVEKQVWDVEGFAVRILHLDGRDVRGDRMGLPPYPFESPAKNDLSVEKWKSTRFRQTYPGFQVEVVDSDGAAVHGNTRLGTVRDTYLDDDLQVILTPEEQAHADLGGNHVSRDH